MSGDPWSRPTYTELKSVIESLGKSSVDHNRNAERLELTIPAEIQTSRGNVICAVTREVSRYGIGLLHKGAITLGEVTVRMASDSREFQYKVRLEWCRPCENGMFISGGRFINEDDE